MSKVRTTRWATDEEHARASGLRCPNIYCRAHEIEGGPVTIDQGQAYQDVSCLVCDAAWVDPPMQPL